MVLTDNDPAAWRPGCCHADGELRTTVYANGARHFVFQCQTCGRAGGAIKQSHWIVASLTTEPPAADATLADRYWEAITEAARQERDEQNADWWDWYNGYLLTDEWRRRSEAVILRDGGRCMASLDGCTRRATEAHHLTYKHAGNEPLFDLIAVCHACHQQITAMDRERRMAA